MAGATNAEHVKRIRRELIQADVTLYGLLKSESRYLPRVIHEDEHIHAVVYGQHHSNSAMLIATDRRIIYLDKKPMALFMDEVTYDVVSGIELEIHTLFASVTLHTAVANYDIKFANIHCADKFTAYIEEQRVKREKFRENEPGIPVKIETMPQPPADLAKEQIDDTSQNNLAGYYWIPHDEEEAEELQVDLR
jgi:hypothetical protein